MNSKKEVTRRAYRDTEPEFTLPLLGFGVMRLPQKEEKIDYITAEAMVDRAMQSGCNYFDTAYVYHNGESEKFLGKALAKYPRNSYYLTSKMPVFTMKCQADNERIFNEQLERTNAGYFDFYFLHWMNEKHWSMAQDFKTLEFLEKMKKAGKIKHIGFSFHGEPETLKKIAEAYPWELVQIQLNYLDWKLYRADEQYELLTAMGIPVAVMEPLKGGTLVNLTPDAKQYLAKADPAASPASWGLRYAASLPNVRVVLSGMSSPEQVEDNLKTFTDFAPLTDEEQKIISETVSIYWKSGVIPCTGCRYCCPCPAGVDIPRNIALHNQLKSGQEQWRLKRLVYDTMAAEQRASACTGCGACKSKCPQKLDIPSILKEITAEFN